MAICIVETERPKLKSMIDTDHLNYSINQHMNRIKEESGSPKIMKFFQLIGEYSVKHAGISFMNNKTMAKALGVHVRTIQRYTSFLEELRVMLKIPTNRKNNRGQTSNTYIILPVLKSVVSRVCHGVCHPFNPSFNPSLKQENNNYKEIQLDDEKLEQKETLMKYAEYKINDIINKGIIVEHPSRYMEKFFKNEIRKAEYKEKLRAERQLQRQEQQPTKLPFYDWRNASDITAHSVKNPDFDKNILDELGVY